MENVNVKEILCNELIKNGYAEENGKRVWNIANRSFLHLTAELSQKFLDLLNFELYKKNVFDRELNIIKENAESFIQEIGTDTPFNLIDLGCGDGSKAKAFISALNGRAHVRYCPVSPDASLTDLAVKTVKEGNFESVVSYEPYNLSFDRLGEVAPVMRCGEFQRNVILLHGSILASYEITDFLFLLSNGMFDGDHILIGNGIRRGERLVNLPAYQQPIFSEWFMILMKELGFTEDEVEYSARFGNSRVEGFYTLKTDKIIKCGNREIALKESDEILVAILYKYYLEELEKFLNMYFSTVKTVKDSEDEYILSLCHR